MEPLAPSQECPPPPQRRGPLELGQKLGADLKVVGVLGEGGTAAVYRAFHGVLQREVAIKVCTVTGPHAPEAQMRLIREAKMCASIRDTRVPRVFGLDYLDDGTPYLVMEKVEGEALSKTLARWRVPVRYACEVGCALLDALSALHRAGLIHRDIKPSNLLVDLRPAASRRLVLIDFGVGKFVRQDPDDPQLTVHGALVGTPHYMAPEQVAGFGVEARSDLYAAGVVLYEMLAGRTPFMGNSVVEVLAAVLRDPIPPLDSVRPGLPASLLRVVEKATARKVGDRFETAAKMRIALAAATEDVIALGSRSEFEALARPTAEPGDSESAARARRDAEESGTAETKLAAPRAPRQPVTETLR
jgi:serine/threonine protein kinase